MIDFTEEQIERYSRHIILPEVGGEGQSKLLNAKVLVIGAGGLGAPIIYYLAACGIGKIGIVDSDTVELNNLQRQIIHTTERVGMSKADSAKETISKLNPDVNAEAINLRLTSKNIMDVIKDYDIIVDGSDNFPTRYLVNDACVLAKKTLSHGAILRFQGQVMTIVPEQNGPCYRCLFEEPPPPGLVPSCHEAGVIGVLPGVIGVIQATEVVKYILGKGDLLLGRLFIYQALEMTVRTVKVPKNPRCPICGDNPSIKELIDYEEFCQLRKNKNEGCGI